VPHHPCLPSSLAKAAAPERASTELGADFYRLLPPNMVQSTSIRNSRPNNVVHKYLAASTVCLKETCKIKTSSYLHLRFRLPNLVDLRSQSSDSVELLEIIVVFGVLEVVCGFELRFRPALPNIFILVLITGILKSCILRDYDTYWIYLDPLSWTYFRRDERMVRPDIRRY